MRIQSPGWTFSFSRRPMLMALRTPLTFTFARSCRSRSSITSPGIPRHIPAPLVPPNVVLPALPVRLRGPQSARHDLASTLGHDADDALGEAHAAAGLYALGEQCPAHREALAQEVLELVGLGDGVEGADGLLQALASVTSADVVADCEADECFHPCGPPFHCWERLVRASLHGLEFEVPLDIGKRRDDECCDASGHDCLDQLHACPSFRLSLAANTESSISWLLWTLFWIRWMMSTRRRTAGSTAASTVAVRPRPSSTFSGSQPTTRALPTLPPSAFSIPKMASGSRPWASMRADSPSEAAWTSGDSAISSSFGSMR